MPENPEETEEDNHKAVVSGAGLQFSWKKVAAALGGLVVVAIIVLGSLWLSGFWNNEKSSSNMPVGDTNLPDPNSLLPANFSSFTPDQKSDYYVMKGEYDKSIAIYQEKLKSSKSSVDKANAYISMASIEMSAQNYDKAYQYELAAYKLTPNPKTAKFVASAAQQAGDNKTAAHYYQVALKQLEAENQPSNGRAINELKADLAEVQK